MFNVQSWFDLAMQSPMDPRTLSVEIANAWNGTDAMTSINTQEKVGLEAPTLRQAQGRLYAAYGRIPSVGRCFQPDIPTQI